LEYEVLREEVRVLRLADCRSVDECISMCFEDVALEADPEDLVKLGWLPRDCIVVVKVKVEDRG
jgi:hypothetical protein